jgi:hypothetical protein
MRITTLRLSNFQSFGPEPTTIDLAELTYVPRSPLDRSSGRSVSW